MLRRRRKTLNRLAAVALSIELVAGGDWAALPPSARSGERGGIRPPPILPLSGGGEADCTGRAPLASVKMHRRHHHAPSP